MESSASPDSRPGWQSGVVPQESFLGAIIAITKHSAPGLAMAILRPGAALDIRAIRSGLGSGGGGLGFGREGRQ